MAEVGETVKAAEEAVKRISTNRRITWRRIIIASSAVFAFDASGMGFLLHKDTAHLWDMVDNNIPAFLIFCGKHGPF